MNEANSSGDNISTDIGAGATNVNVGKNINQAIYHFTPTQPIAAETLTAAMTQLAALPLDTIPPLTALPPGSRMPLTPNALFVGREEALHTLARTLKGGQTVAIGAASVAATTGGGGYGKTQLAVEFAHRYGQYFAGGVFWLNFADAAGVPAEIATCGGAGYLNLRPDYGLLKLEDQVRLVLAQWQDGRPRLLIFDNCEEETLLAAWCPTHGACRILVTSRRAEWQPHLGVQCLPLAVLPRRESIALLHKFRPDVAAGDAALAALAAELGDLPLALHLAGSYLNHYQRTTTPAAFLAQLRSPALLEHRALQAGRHAPADLNPTKHVQDVARTFALSYDRLSAANPVDALALTLLARAAYFAPNTPIPQALLLASLPHPSPPSGEDGVTGSNFALDAEDALHRLVELGLLESEADGAPRLHRLLARFVQAVGADGDAQTAVEQTAYNEANRLNKAGYPLVLLAWQTHLRHITDQARERQAKRAADLCNELGYHLQAQGEYAAARPYYEQALAIRKAVLGEQHPDTARSLNNLGYLLQAQGEYAAARPYYEQALAIFEKRLGPQHPNTRIVRGNLAALLAALKEQGQ